jgi:hypothetical protein
MKMARRSHLARMGMRDGLQLDPDLQTSVQTSEIYRKT